MEELNLLLQEMKEKGIESAVIRKDGVQTASIISLDETTAQTISSFSNTIDAIMKTMKDKNNEIEISSDKGYIVIIPVKEYYLFSVIESREHKKTIREYAAKVAALL